MGRCLLQIERPATARETPSCGPSHSKASRMSITRSTTWAPFSARSAGSASSSGSETSSMSRGAARDGLCHTSPLEAFRRPGDANTLDMRSNAVDTALRAFLDLDHRSTVWSMAPANRLGISPVSRHGSQAAAEDVGHHLDRPAWAPRFATWATSTAPASSSPVTARRSSSSTASAATPRRTPQHPAVGRERLPRNGHRPAVARLLGQATLQSDAVPTLRGAGHRPARLRGHRTGPHRGRIAGRLGRPVAGAGASRSRRPADPQHHRRACASPRVTSTRSPARGASCCARAAWRQSTTRRRETIRKRLEWLMATPDRVTDELVDVRAEDLHATRGPARRYGRCSRTRSGSAPGRAGRSPKTGWLRSRRRRSSSGPSRTPGTGPDVGRKIASLIPERGVLLYGRCRPLAAVGASGGARPRRQRVPARRGRRRS